jgi:hypothetical protein
MGELDVPLFGNSVLSMQKNFFLYILKLNATTTPAVRMTLHLES